MSRKLPVILTAEEQQLLLDQFTTRYPTQERNRVMIKLILDTGLRRAEAINLRWNDINLMSGKLKVVQGKGAKDRILWVQEETLEELKHWKERQVDELTKREAVNKYNLVFTTLTGNKLNPNNFYKVVNGYSQKAGIVKEVSPHTLRHTFATDLYRETKNIRLVQKALGHEDLSTTMIYTHIVDDELEEAMKGFRKDK
ncbi:integrase [Orenia metallireducens]|uniref:Integrase n=1 Tax=Orenia metallireducens TaxID=1413210 RepID=A0A1C0AD69_9FIRM|nr:tyrosine-type recombinase/integrase [Orenia metallireducens]OCL28601.1 integrase [Orenia metallireducens]